MESPARGHPVPRRATTAEPGRAPARPSPVAGISNRYRILRRSSLRRRNGARFVGGGWRVPPQKPFKFKLLERFSLPAAKDLGAATKIHTCAREGRSRKPPGGLHSSFLRPVDGHTVSRCYIATRMEGHMAEQQRGHTMTRKLHQDALPTVLNGTDGCSCVSCDE